MLWFHVLWESISVGKVEQRINIPVLMKSSIPEDNIQLNSECSLILHTQSRDNCYPNYSILTETAHSHCSPEIFFFSPWWSILFNSLPSFKCAWLLLRKRQNSTKICFCLFVFMFWNIVVQLLSHVQISNTIDCSTAGFSVLYHLLELAQTYVHWVSDAIQPSHPLLPPSPPTFNLF